MPPKIKYTNALGLDIGAKRIGVARVNAIARLPEPLETIPNDEAFIQCLEKLITEHSADVLVVGLPRNMSGEETAQSIETRRFVEQVLQPALTIDIVFQDETLSSVAAESYSAQDKLRFGSDALAATEILKDFLKQKEV